MASVAGVSEEEDYGGQMDEIRIWDKALSPDEIKKGSVLDIVYFPPSFLRRYKRWFR